MLSRIGRLFRRLGRPDRRRETGRQESDRQSTSLPLATEPHGEEAADASDPLARQVLRRTRPVTVSRRTIHRVRSLKVSAPPLARDLLPRVRRDVPTSELPLVTNRAAVPIAAEAPSQPHGDGESTPLAGSSGDAAWDALWKLRGTRRSAPMDTAASAPRDTSASVAPLRRPAPAAPAPRVQRAPGPVPPRPAQRRPQGRPAGRVTEITPGPIESPASQAPAPDHPVSLPEQQVSPVVPDALPPMSRTPEGGPPPVTPAPLPVQRAEADEPLLVAPDALPVPGTPAGEPSPVTPASLPVQREPLFVAPDALPPMPRTQQDGPPSLAQGAPPVRRAAAGEPPPVAPASLPPVPPATDGASPRVSPASPPAGGPSPGPATSRPVQRAPDGAARLDTPEPRKARQTAPGIEGVSPTRTTALEETRQPGRETSAVAASSEAWPSAEPPSTTVQTLRVPEGPVAEAPPGSEAWAALPASEPLERTGARTERPADAEPATDTRAEQPSLVPQAPRRAARVLDGLRRLLIQRPATGRRASPTAPGTQSAPPASASIQGAPMEDEPVWAEIVPPRAEGTPPGPAPGARPEEATFAEPAPRPQPPGPRPLSPRTDVPRQQPPVGAASLAREIAARHRPVPLTSLGHAVGPARPTAPVQRAPPDQATAAPTDALVQAPRIEVASPVRSTAPAERTPSEATAMPHGLPAPEEREPSAGRTQPRAPLPAGPGPVTVQRAISSREALRQVMQPRLVPAMVQTAPAEGDTATERAGADQESDAQQAPNVDTLARDVYRILRRRLLVERERGRL